jgi:PAS domain S-box-containing protein
LDRCVGDFEQGKVMNEKPSKNFDRQLEQAQQEIAYYKRIAQEAGDLRLREVEALSQLVVRHKKVEEELREYKKNLEKIVEERTTALKQANTKLEKELTDRITAEEERQRLATAIEQAAESIVICDNQGTILYVNPAFEKTSQYTKKEAVGKSTSLVEAIGPGEDKHKNLWKMLRSGRVWKGRLTNRKKDGTLYEEDATISPVINAKGQICNYVAVKRDVTQEVLLEKKLRQAQKMEAIGTLAGGIAHDFNNILAAIMGFAEISQLSLPEDNTVRLHLDEVLKASYRAKSLVNQILTFSRQKECETKPIRIAVIVKEAIKMLRATLPSTIKIVQAVDTSTGAIVADPTQIHQIMMNLCTNAAHAMEKSGGTLTVSLRDIYFNQEMAIHSPDLQEGEYVELIVKDSGHGIEPQILERIFDPYFTTKELGKGTGMGLSVVHGIVKTYNGAVTVKSEEGRGTTFQILIPKAKGREDHQRGKQKKISAGSERILFVDDEKILVDIAKKMLEKIGYRVTTRTSSVEALEAFKARPLDYDLLVTDMTMPNMTGDQLAEEIMKIRPGLPVILCTGYSAMITPETAVGKGIQQLLEKPLSIKELSASIRMVLDNKKGDEEEKALVSMGC